MVCGAALPSAIFFWKVGLFRLVKRLIIEIIPEGVGACGRPRSQACGLPIPDLAATGSRRPPPCGNID